MEGKIKGKKNEKEEENENEKKYKVLYETSMKKIKLLNDDIIDLKQEIKGKNKEILDLNKKNENILIEIENNKNKEMKQIENKYKLDLNKLEIEIKCIKDEYNEYKEKMEGTMKIENNNNLMMIENLKRENDALCNELTMYQQNERTLTPNSSLISPRPTNNAQNGLKCKDYTKRIQDSPLTERKQNELLSISKVKNLENDIKNLKEENISNKNQLFAKKELIKEFEGLLQKNQMQQKQILDQYEDGKKIINLYQILTSTKIEKKRRSENKEDFLCRTVKKENNKNNNGAMLEYGLSLGINHGNNNKENIGHQSFCDYQLISSHNLSKPLNESLSQNITFYAKDAPLFIKEVIEQIFINTNHEKNTSS